MSKKDTIRI